MEPIELPADFNEFLRLLNANQVDYLLDGTPIRMISLDDLEHLP